MCGIAGAINYQQYDLDQLLDALSHRGPDETGRHIENQVALVHTRLAIQDLAGGKQPFHYGQHTLIFNGEIYNHHELRNRLPEFHFKTSSDTETLLYLYIKLGYRMFALLDGMFALAVLDKSRNYLFLARDRAGEKPIYYVKTHNSFLFASELNAIKRVFSPTINEDAIGSYLRSGLFYHTTTPYQEITELSAGCYMEIDLDTQAMRTKKYFDLVSFYQTTEKNDSLDEKLELLDQKLSKSVKDRLLSSDLEVGVFLSGGIDSNLIAAIASQYKKNLKTFTVKFSKTYNESQLAKLTVDQYQTQHIEIDLTSSLQTGLASEIETILSNYGEPFMDSSAIPSFYAAKEAKKHLTVVLMGDGADEIFGGYRRYVPLSNRLIDLVQIFSFIKPYLPKPHHKKSFYNYLYRLFASSSKTGLDAYLSMTTDIFEDVYTFHSSSVTQRIENFLTEINTKKLSSLSKMLIADFNIILGSDLLVKVDIATMAHSLEARCPFLSKYLLEFAPTLLDRDKIHGVTTKYLLRQLAKKYLSPVLVTQPKRGFEIPLKEWVEGELKAPIFSYLTGDCYALKFVDRTFIGALLANKLAVSAEKRAKMLWSLFSLEVWYKNEKNFANRRQLCSVAD